MYTDITQSQIEQYQLDGCLIFDKFLTPIELEEIRDSVTITVEKMGKEKIAGLSDTEVVEGDSYYDQVFLQKLNLWKINKTIKKYFLNPKLGEMLCKLEGIDGVRVWHDQTLQKMAWGNPTAWHLDNPYWSFHSPNALSIWIALDDATIQNGCLYYIPGSHKIGRYDNVEIAPDVGGLFKVYPELKNTEPIIAEMKAGQAGVHNGLTAHGAGPNMTPYPRRAMTCAYMPVGSKFNGRRNILSKDYFKSLKVGDVLNSDSQNPLVWKK